VGDEEFVDLANGVVLRRVVVGPLRTNCWIVHPVGHRDGILVDPGAEPQRILAAAADLKIRAIVLTHAHFDHVLAVADVAGAIGAPVFAHPADAPVWPHELDHLYRTGHFDAGTATGQLLTDDIGALRPNPAHRLWNGKARPIVDGQRMRLGPLTITVFHTPGHTPGGVTLQTAGHLLTGDTLFPGGPGLTGWPLSDFATIMTSVRLLLAQPLCYRIHPGHGRDTTVQQERPAIATWQSRGW